MVVQVYKFQITTARCVVLKLVEIDTIDCMTHSIDGFGPKVKWRLVLIMHCLCHLNKFPIVPFGNSILFVGGGGGVWLWCTERMHDRSRIL